MARLPERGGQRVKRSCPRTGTPESPDDPLELFMQKGLPGLSCSATEGTAAVGDADNYVPLETCPTAGSRVLAPLNHHPGATYTEIATRRLTEIAPPNVTV